MKQKCPYCSMNTCSFTGLQTFYKVELECKTCHNKFFQATNDLCKEDQDLIKELIEKHRCGELKLKTLQSTGSKNEKPKQSQSNHSIIKWTQKSLKDKQGQEKPKKKNTNLTKGNSVDTYAESGKTRLLTSTEETFNRYLKKYIKNYKKRPIQVKLATEIADSISRLRKQILIAEAGVGTGKSFAYLVPTMYYTRSPVYRRYGWQKKPIIISTKTIALQEQLINKDIPAISKLFPGVDGFLAKGKSHYLCTMRYSDALYKGKLNKILSEDKRFELSDWVATTTTGDRNKAPELPDKVWDLINVRNCNPPDCNDRKTCRMLVQKNIRANFDGIIVTNHNLLIDDLILRKKSGCLWPEPGMIIIDEAHNLEDSARSELSQEISTKQIYNLIREVKRISSLDQYINDQIYDELDRANEKFLSIAAKYIDQQEPDDNNQVYIPGSDDLFNAGKAMLKALEALSLSVDSAYAGYISNVKIERQIDRQVQNINNIMNIIENWLAKPNNYYLAGERKGEHINLTLGPISVADFLKDSLWNKSIPIVMTSGTLTANGNFEHISKNLGLNDIEKVREFKGQNSNLVNRNNVALYIAGDMPKPRHYNENEEDVFTQAAAERIEELIKCSLGRALVLFTSHRRLNTAYELLKSKHDIPWEVIHQRNRNAAKIFRENKTSILMATGSYWEGIDVVGDALTLVIMDKLPFPSPQDAVTQAKEFKMRDVDIDPRMNLYVPEMMLKLKQGAGRLLRHENDWGTIAILDSRAADNYYNLVKGVLPPHIEIKSIEGLKKWYQNHQIIKNAN